MTKLVSSLLCSVLLVAALSGCKSYAANSVVVQPERAATLRVVNGGLQNEAQLLPDESQALYEGAVYDANGELLTGTMSDYAVPKASMVPRYELDRTVTPSPVNPLGAKGAGEAGTIASTPAVANAVIDAVTHLGIKHIDMPLTPEKIWRAIAAAQA